MSRTAGLRVRADELVQLGALALELKAERDALRSKLKAIGEIATEAVNEFETPEMRLAMIVRLVGRMSRD